MYLHRSKASCSAPESKLEDGIHNNLYEFGTQRAQGTSDLLLEISHLLRGCQQGHGPGHSLHWVWGGLVGIVSWCGPFVWVSRVIVTDRLQGCDARAAVFPKVSIFRWFSWFVKGRRERVILPLFSVFCEIHNNPQPVITQMRSEFEVIYPRGGYRGYLN